MLEFLAYGFMQRALLAGVLVALVCALVGVFLVMRRMSLLGDGLAHISFGGIAFGLFFKIYPIFSALLFAIVAAFGIQKLKNLKVYGDAAIAIFFSFGLALGVVLISYSKGFGLDLFSYLFGSILAVSEMDIAVIFTIGVAAFAAVLVFYKELLYITFDEEAAKASGIPVERMNMMLVLLTAIIVVLSMRIV
ncbi:MAG: metal ABC transporter permease, partial [Candidatus Micrarchaeota archaeon]